MTDLSGPAPASRRKKSARRAPMPPPPPDAVYLSVDTSVSIDEMREWSPNRIGRYFAGIALALYAIHYDEPTP